ncbi:MAG: S-adenosylmethionine:tRNA ribosyltransferase-isomerase [Calditrichaeota bacterium]|nr:S-adenosylmethionine:tRNA ribosyltransferase-isomerase [Calditrichota bacterium]
MDRRSDYLYELPDDLIAQQPVEPRDASRLLVLDRARDSLAHRRFHNLAQFLDPGDTLVFNDTKVIPARLFGHRETGGRVELLLLEDFEPTVWSCLAKPAKRVKSDTRVRFSGGWTGTVVGEGDAGRRVVRFLPPHGAPVTVETFLAWLDEAGATPLPPYIHRPAEPGDRDRYQTIYAKKEGSVAAPTAGLHFTPALLRRIERRGVRSVRLTLHVGIGTFRPVEVENLAEHVMDEERYHLSAAAAGELNATRDRGGRIVAVGTTSVRTLESIADNRGRFRESFGRTCLFIRPSYRFCGVDALITNFHLPGSTLLMLVSAFAGRERILAAYREAVRRRYRFFSYGDAMLIV